MTQKAIPIRLICNLTNLYSSHTVKSVSKILQWHACTQWVFSHYFIVLTVKIHHLHHSASAEKKGVSHLLLYLDGSFQYLLRYCKGLKLFTVCHITQGQGWSLFWVQSLSCSTCTEGQKNWYIPCSLSILLCGIHKKYSNHTYTTLKLIPIRAEDNRRFHQIKKTHDISQTAFMLKIHVNLCCIRHEGVKTCVIHHKYVIWSEISLKLNIPFTGCILKSMLPTSDWFH